MQRDEAALGRQHEVGHVSRRVRPTRPARALHREHARQEVSREVVRGGAVQARGLLTEHPDHRARVGEAVAHGAHVARHRAVGAWSLNERRAVREQRAGNEHVNRAHSGGLAAPAEGPASQALVVVAQAGAELCGVGAGRAEEQVQHVAQPGDVEVRVVAEAVEHAAPPRNCFHLWQ